MTLLITLWGIPWPGVSYMTIQNLSLAIIAFSFAALASQPFWPEARSAKISSETLVG